MEKLKYIKADGGLLADFTLRTIISQILALSSLCKVVAVTSNYQH